MLSQELILPTVIINNVHVLFCSNVLRYLSISSTIKFIIKLIKILLNFAIKIFIGSNVILLTQNSKNNK